MAEVYFDEFVYEDIVGDRVSVAQESDFTLDVRFTREICD